MPTQNQEVAPLKPIYPAIYLRILELIAEEEAAKDLK